MAYKVPRSIFTEFRISGLNILSAGEQFTFFLSKGNFVCDYVTFVLNSVSGFVSVPQVTVGSNSPFWNNILSNFDLTGLSTAGHYLTAFIDTQALMIPVGIQVDLNIVVPATSTTYNIDAIATGRYI